MRRFVRLCAWVALNGTIVWLAWTGVNGSEGAGRVLAFAAWVFGPLQFLAGMSSEVCLEVTKKGRSVPSWMSHAVGIGLIGFLVWHGWWWTAIGFLLAEIGEVAIFRKPNDQGRATQGAKKDA